MQTLYLLIKKAKLNTNTQSIIPQLINIKKQRKEKAETHQQAKTRKNL